MPAGLLDRFLQPERRRALVTARVPDANSQTAEPAFNELEAALNEVRSTHPDYELHLTGTGVVAHRNVDLMIVDFSMGLGMAALVIFGVLSIAYRSLRIGLISLLPNAFPLVVAAATLVLLGRELQIASAIAFTICLGIAVDDTIHFLSRFRRELTLDGDVEEAVVRAFLAVGRALVITTAVLVGGFSVMFLSVIPTTQLFALIGIVGMLAALVGDLFLLPAILVIFATGRPRDEVRGADAGALRLGEHFQAAAQQFHQRHIRTRDGRDRPGQCRPVQLRKQRQYLMQPLGGHPPRRPRGR